MNESYEKIIDKVLESAKDIIMGANGPKKMEITICLDAGRTPTITYDISGFKAVPINGSVENDD